MPMTPIIPQLQTMKIKQSKTPEVTDQSTNIPGTARTPPQPKFPRKPKPQPGPPHSNFPLESSPLAAFSLSPVPLIFLSVLFFANPSAAETTSLGPPKLTPDPLPAPFFILSANMPQFEPAVLDDDDPEDEEDA